MEDVFVVDSNVLMSVNRILGFDTTPHFWDTIKDRIIEKKIVILDVVRGEINKGNDELVSWINSIDKELIIDHRKDDSILECYAQIMQEIENSDKYSQDASFQWFNSEDYADPWIIALAMSKKYVIVSLETKKNSSSGSPARNPKIPTIADVFGIETINLQELMKRINLLWL